MSPSRHPRTTPRGPLPAWARAADALGLAVAGLAAARGGIRRVPAAPGRPPRVGHLRRAHPDGGARHPAGPSRRSGVITRSTSGRGGASSRWWAADGVRAVVPVWAASRLAVLLVGFLAVGTFGYRDGGAPFRLYKNEFLDLPARHDAGWYLGIAVDGYKWDPASAGPPEHRLHAGAADADAVRRAPHRRASALGRPVRWCSRACLWAFVYVYRLARSALGDAEQAAWAVALLAAYPFAVFYSAVYTESIFLSVRGGRVLSRRAAEYVPRRRRSCCCAGSRGPTGSCSPCRIALVAVWPASVAAWRDGRERRRRAALPRRPRVAAGDCGGVGGGRGRARVLRVHLHADGAAAGLAGGPRGLGPHLRHVGVAGPVPGTGAGRALRLRALAADRRGELRGGPRRPARRSGR